MQKAADSPAALNFAMSSLLSICPIGLAGFQGDHGDGNAEFEDDVGRFRIGHDIKFGTYRMGVAVKMGAAHHRDLRDSS